MHLQQWNNHSLDYLLYILKKYIHTHTIITAENRVNFSWFEMWNSAEVPSPHSQVDQPLTIEPLPSISLIQL